VYYIHEMNVETGHAYGFYIKYSSGRHLGITEGSVCEICCLIWHDFLTTCHDDRLRHSSNLKVITSTAREASVLVILMGMIYEVCRRVGFRWHDAHTKFHNDHFRHSSNIEVLTQQIERLQC
jgi:hypothetical protein